MEKTTFEQTLVSMFPEVATSGVVSRKQITETMEQLGTNKYPTWLMVNKVGRGLYAIEGNLAVASPSAVTRTVVEKVAVPQTYSADMDSKSLIPFRDKNFVPFGNFSDVETIIKSRSFYPSFISGPTGNGKSTMVEQICAKHKIPLIRVNLNAQTDEEQLIGSKTLVDGNVQIVEGPVLIAMRLGIPLLLDEIDASAPNAIMCLQGILEGKPYYFKLKNEMVVPQPGFNLIATANTKGKGSEDGRYIGTNVLNEAFLERFAITFEQEYPSSKVEQKIVLNLMEARGCVDEKFAETLVKWADAIRRTFDDGGVDETITTRRMVHIVNAFAMFKNQKKAVQLCLNRFDEATKSAFMNLFEKVSTEPEVVLEQQPAVSEEIPF